MFPIELQFYYSFPSHGSVLDYFYYSTNKHLHQIQDDKQTDNNDSTIIYAYISLYDMT